MIMCYDVSNLSILDAGCRFNIYWDIGEFKIYLADVDDSR